MTNVYKPQHPISFHSKPGSIQDITGDDLTPTGKLKPSPPKYSESVMQPAGKEV